MLNRRDRDKQKRIAELKAESKRLSEETAALLAQRKAIQERPSIPKPENPPIPEAEVFPIYKGPEPEPIQFIHIVPTEEMKKEIQEREARKTPEEKAAEAAKDARMEQMWKMSHIAHLLSLGYSAEQIIKYFGYSQELISKTEADSELCPWLHKTSEQK